MITRELTLCGKAVKLAYCYATEIAYKDITGDEIVTYFKSAHESIAKEEDPDIKQTIQALLACLIAYYNSNGEETPLKSEDIINEAKPAEIGMAIITMLDMRMEFYHVPKTAEPKVKKKKTKAKS
jgi:hypothetical protein